MTDRVSQGDLINTDVAHFGGILASEDGEGRDRQQKYEIPRRIK